MRESIRVHRIELRGALAPALAQLSAAEQQRAARFLSDEPRVRFALCRAALRSILGRELDADPRAIEFAEGAHGKPRVAGAHAGALHFNVSHSGELALIAVCRAAPIGVDVEQMRALDKIEGLAEHVLSARELERWRALPDTERQREFYRCWTLKEAILKACGLGITTALAQIEPDDERARANDAERPVSAARGLLDAPELLRDAASGAPRRWTLHELPIDTGYAAALATQGDDLAIVSDRT